MIQGRKRVRKEGSPHGEIFDVLLFFNYGASDGGQEISSITHLGIGRTTRQDDKDGQCKGTFGCHSFGLNSDPASAVSHASDNSSAGLPRLPLDFRCMICRLPWMNELPLDFRSSTSPASAPLPLPLLFRDPVNISFLLFT